MKMFGIALVLAPVMALAQGGSPAGFHYWTKADLEKASMTPAAKSMGSHLMLNRMGTEDGEQFLMVRRDGRGEAEYHATEGDVMFIESGHGVLTYGGTMVNPRDTAANEKRAPSIKGGAEKALAPGDVVTIPARLPHQVVPRAGETIVYFVLKVKQ
jgi:mannose-6-phosphate isomerase-like protein (cupin superfamily)